MGIDKNRFSNIDISIDKFLCGLCEDVVSDPILTNVCEHFVCRACITADMSDVQCPTCSAAIDGYIEIGAGLERIYSKIKLRCAYDACKEVLTIENYVEHERKCPEGFYECSQACGFKIRLSQDECHCTHNCINVLQVKIVELETKNAGLQCLNDQLLATNQKLKIKNVRLSSAGDKDEKRRRGN